MNSVSQFLSGGLSEASVGMHIEPFGTGQLLLPSQSSGTLGGLIWAQVGPSLALSLCDLGQVAQLLQTSLRGH